VITGASSGIAKAIALQLAPKGTRMVLLARREKELQEVADECNRLAGKTVAVAFSGDVTKPEDCKFVLFPLNVSAAANSTLPTTAPQSGD
jgi:NADP-dependent 3-hydroxy acid dehydrogenase YdfG